MQENTDQNNSEYQHFLSSELFSVVGQSVVKDFLKQPVEIETLI